MRYIRYCKTGVILRYDVQYPEMVFMVFTFLTTRASRVRAIRALFGSPSFPVNGTTQNLAFQQDADQPYLTLSMSQYFCQKLRSGGIGKADSVLRLPWSPDLTFCDSFFYSYIRDYLFTNLLISIIELKKKTPAAISSISEDTLYTVVKTRNCGCTYMCANTMVIWIIFKPSKTCILSL